MLCVVGPGVRFVLVLAFAAAAAAAADAAAAIDARCDAVSAVGWCPIRFVAGSWVLCDAKARAGNTGGVSRHTEMGP